MKQIGQMEEQTRVIESERDCLRLETKELQEIYGNLQREAEERMDTLESMESKKNDVIFQI